jgi:flavorubredoxin
MITNQQSGTRIDEIAAGVFRISTPVDIPVLPDGFSFNQYLLVDEEPLLFQSGLRRMFPLVREAISAVIPAEKLRHVGYSHFEADESGALNDFLAIAPQAAPFSSEIGALTSLNDFADRTGRGLGDGEQFSTGSHRLEWIYTPHVPHGWDCGVLFDHTTGTLFCGDLFTQGGSKNPPVTQEDVVGPSEQFRGPLDYFAHAKGTGKILERLAMLNPKMLACMHGSAFQGDGAAQLRKLRMAVSDAKASVAG